MTGTAAQFLRLVLADPDADGPRLVYADWLDRQGETARAEFIRVQCAAAALPADDPRHDMLRQRADVLLEQHRIAWGEPLAGLANRWDWRRGFPEFIRLDTKTFLDRGEAMFAAVPVRHVELLNVLPHVNRLEESQLLDRIVGLTVMNQVGSGAAIAKALARSRHVANLTELHLVRVGLTATNIRTLLTTSRFERLTMLDLRDNPLGPDGVAAILTSPRLAELTSLDLSGTGCTAAALAALPEDGRLTALNMSDNELGDIGVGMLVGWSALAGLRTIDLSRTGIGDEAVAVLAESPHLTCLRRLALNGNRITEAGKRRLLESPRFRAIPALELRENWS
jgi:uncharacterized protein (TIGR02996 family)